MCLVRIRCSRAYEKNPSWIIFYFLDTNNKYLDPSSTCSALADAKALLEQNGSLSEVALLLEAAIQKGEFGEGGYETWILLGETRSMDEREEAGMRALVEGVKNAEAAGAAGVGQMVSRLPYLTEKYWTDLYMRSVPCHLLHKWVVWASFLRDASTLAQGAISTTPYPRWDC